MQTNLLIMKRELFCAVLLTCLQLYVFRGLGQQKLIVDNSKPRFDVEGRIIDAHDGRIIQFGKRFYWYGTAYGNTNGFTEANEYVCYSSTDMQRWKKEGVLLPLKPKGVYYRPHVVYNNRTGKYILWYNWYPKLWNGQFGVAESNSPAGPFTIVNDNVSVKHSVLGVGDLGVFVDNDGAAYLSYNTINGHKVSVEKLNNDYTASTMQGSAFLAEHCEAGSMFKRNGTYYLLTDYTCCFCTQGSGAKVFTATSPLGPYTYRQNINRYPGQLAPVMVDGAVNDNFFETLDAKPGHALLVQLRNAAPVSGITLVQFTGNRKGQCGEVNKPAVHEPILTYQFAVEYFLNGEWNGLSTNPLVEMSAQQVRYRFMFPPVKAEKIRIRPVYKDTASPLLVSEIALQSKEKFQVFKTSAGDGKPIIPAQQTYVMELNVANGKQYVWMGDLWGSASDNVKGHDYQFWSAPLQFYKDGTIKALEWTDTWTLQLKW
jgi:hypothetical protein